MSGTSGDRPRRPPRPAAPAAGLPAGRHEARERALMLLYEADRKGLPVTDVVAGLPTPPDPFAAELAEATDRRARELDGMLAPLLVGWRLERTPLVDRLIMRMAAHELTATDTPTAVVIDEAVELAKRYSTDDSGRFVNGVLASLARQVRAPGSDGAGTGGR